MRSGTAPAASVSNADMVIGADTRGRVSLHIKKEPSFRLTLFMFALPIFPASRPASIVGAHELNFCVRDGNRWTLTAINTNSYGWVLPIFYMSKALCASNFGDPYRIRTDVNGVRGRCLNHLTNGPFGTPAGTRTQDPLIKSQLLYQLSYRCILF